MKTKTTIITTFSAVLLAIGVTAVVLINQPPKTEVETKTSTRSQAEQPVRQEAVTFAAEKDKDVLAQTKEHATVVTKDSSFGPYVDSLNGIVGGTDGKYWSFYVDGQLAQKGAADYKTVGGEKIEWKFE